MTDTEKEANISVRKKQQIDTISIVQANFKSVRRKALRVTVIYFIVGCLWILLSDKVATAIFKEASELVIFSTLKGLFYVSSTSVLLFLLIYPYFKKLQEKRALLKALISSIPDIFFYKNTEGLYLGCNKAFEKYAGKPENEISGKTDLELFGEETSNQYRKTDLDVMQSGQTMASERVITYPDGSQVYLETLKTPYYDAAGNISGIIGIGRDMTGRKNREERIQYLSYHDVLTGLYNRSFFQEECMRLDTSRQLPLSVIIGDVNGLKLINDTLGHTEGDKLLTAIAGILKSCCRKCDIVARTGGDEFAILLPKTDSDTAQTVVDRIKDICNDYSSNRKNNILYTNIALGCATKYQPEESLDKVINIAEDFMYRRKLMEHKSMHSAILSSIKTTMSEKNYATRTHADRMTELSRRFGDELGLPERIIDEIELVSTLHDIGKISLDVNVLNKPGQLNKDEWREIHKHPEVGFRIANATPELRHLSEYILCHHERWDGKGYPQGLTGDDIPLISRIIAITDAFDAMTADRPYRKAMSENAAVAEIEKNAGTQFDPNLTGLFIRKVLNKNTRQFETH